MFKFKKKKKTEKEMAKLMFERAVMLARNEREFLQMLDRLQLSLTTDLLHALICLLEKKKVFSSNELDDEFRRCIKRRKKRLEKIEKDKKAMEMLKRAKEKFDKTTYIG